MKAYQVGYFKKTTDVPRINYFYQYREASEVLRQKMLHHVLIIFAPANLCFNYNKSTRTRSCILLVAYRGFQCKKISVRPKLKYLFDLH